MSSLTDELLAGGLTESRLIPTHGLVHSHDREMRATSAWLAVMHIAESFSKAILAYLDAPAGEVTTYTEVKLKNEDGSTHKPDGAIRVKKGSREWWALVEVKTGKSEIRQEQVERYVSLANRYGMDAVLTVSNQLVSSPEILPVSVDGRKTKGLTVRHLSWFRILTEATIQIEHRKVPDPEQAWLLGELHRYLLDEKSGASGIHGMGTAWVGVRNRATTRSLNSTDPEVKEVAETWRQFSEYLGLALRRNLGEAVKVEHEELERACLALADDQQLNAVIKVKNAAGSIRLRADLGSQQVIARTRIQAPKNDKTRAKTRVKWLLAQLGRAPDDLTIEAHFKGKRETRNRSLGVCKQHPEQLLLPDDQSRQPSFFDLIQIRPMGKQNGTAKKSFVMTTKRQALDFYGSVLQGITAWAPKAPKLRPEDLDEDEAALQVTTIDLIDTDGDSLTDVEEAAMGTDPLLADSDGDGLADDVEILDHGTDPMNQDTDSDGFSDSVEIAEGTDPLDPVSHP